MLTPIQIDALNITLSTLGLHTHLQIVSMHNSAIPMIKLTVNDNTLTTYMLNKIRKINNTNIISLHLSDNPDIRDYLLIPLPIDSAKLFKNLYKIFTLVSVEDKTHTHLSSLSSLCELHIPSAKSANVVMHQLITNLTGFDYTILDGTIITKDEDATDENKFKAYIKSITPCGVPVEVVLDIMTSRLRLPTVALDSGALMLHTAAYGDYILTPGEVNSLLHDTEGRPAETILDITSTRLHQLYMDHVESINKE